jgi:hypothetical protein
MIKKRSSIEARDHVFVKKMKARAASAVLKQPKWHAEYLLNKKQWLAKVQIF